MQQSKGLIAGHQAGEWAAHVQKTQTPPRLSGKSFIYLFIYLITLFIFGCVGSSFLCEGSLPSCGKRGPLFIVVRRPLTITASPAAEHRLQTRRFSSCGSLAHGPSCSEARGIFPDQGSNPCRLHRQADSQPLRHQGSPQARVFKDSVRGESHRMCDQLVDLFSDWLVVR